MALPIYTDFWRFVGKSVLDGFTEFIDRSGTQATPASGRMILYSKAQALYTVNAAGTESIVGSGLTQAQILARGLMKS